MRTTATFRGPNSATDAGAAVTRLTRAGFGKTLETGTAWTVRDRGHAFVHVVHVDHDARQTGRVLLALGGGTLPDNCPANPDMRFTVLDSPRRPVYRHRSHEEN